LDLVDQIKLRIKEISIENVAKMIEDEGSFVLIDIREESEWGNFRKRDRVCCTGC